MIFNLVITGSLLTIVPLIAAFLLLLPEPGSPGSPPEASRNSPPSPTPRSLTSFTLTLSTRENRRPRRSGSTSMRRTTGPLLRGFAVLSVLALGATACAAAPTTTARPEGGSTAADIQAALKKGGTVNVWAWEPTLKTVAADFQKKYPKVKINLVGDRSVDEPHRPVERHRGQEDPDVAQVEYFALSQLFSLTKGLAAWPPTAPTSSPPSTPRGPWRP